MSRVLLRYGFPSICASLGTWQIFRWNRKQKILKEIEEQINSTPLQIDSLSQLKSGCKAQLSIKSTGQQALLGPRGLSNSLGYGYTLFEKAKLPNG